MSDLDCNTPQGQVYIKTQMDCIKSVWSGFHNKIPAEKIAHISNLRFIPWMENQKKWYK